MQSNLISPFLFVMKIIDIVRAVTVVQEAIKRKPLGLDISFFSQYDLWIYHAVLDDRLCLTCLDNEKTPRIFGNELRAKFPYLEIIDENTINAKVHPNCRCLLTRITEWDIDTLKWFIQTAPREG